MVILRFSWTRSSNDQIWLQHYCFWSMQLQLAKIYLTRVTTLLIWYWRFNSEGSYCMTNEVRRWEDLSWISPDSLTELSRQGLILNSITSPSPLASRSPFYKSLGPLDNGYPLYNGFPIIKRIFPLTGLMNGCIDPIAVQSSLRMNKMESNF